MIRGKFWAAFSCVTDKESAEEPVLHLLNLFREEPVCPTKDGGVVVVFEVEVPDVMFEPLVTTPVRAIFSTDLDHAKLGLQAIERDLK